MKKTALILLPAALALGGCEVVENNSATAVNVTDQNAMQALEQSADNLDAATDAQANAQAAAITNQADDLELALEDNASTPPTNATGATNAN